MHPIAGYAENPLYAKWVGADNQDHTWEDLDDCDSSTKKCNCDINDQNWRETAGFLTSGTYGMAAFPPKRFYNGDANGSSEWGKLTLGKLMCNGV